jgi:hypothetical protein
MDKNTIKTPTHPSAPAHPVHGKNEPVLGKNPDNKGKHPAEAVHNAPGAGHDPVKAAPKAPLK